MAGAFKSTLGENGRSLILKSRVQILHPFFCREAMRGPQGFNTLPHRRVDLLTK